VLLGSRGVVKVYDSRMAKTAVGTRQTDFVIQPLLLFTFSALVYTGLLRFLVVFIVLGGVLFVLSFGYFWVFVGHIDKV